MKIPTKIRIYGCSHSCPTDQGSWPHALAKNLNMELNIRSLSGHGIDSIFSSVLDDYYSDVIDDETLIILNTSYFFRTNNPFLYLYNDENRPGDIKFDNHHSKHNDELAVIFQNNSGGGDNRQISTFVCDLLGSAINWVQKTHLIQELLLKKTPHFYQWFLDEFRTIEFIYNNIYDIKLNKKVDILQKYNIRIHSNEKYHKEIPHFKNVINPPKAYTNFNDFIYDNSISNSNRHLNELGSKKMSNIILNHLKQNGY